jgi:uncharacterized protein (DUF2336 family)
MHLSQLTSAEHTATEVALYDDVVTMVLDEVEPVARAELAKRMADIAEPPRKVLLQLAEDQIRVAEPILARLKSSSSSSNGRSSA